MAIIKKIITIIILVMVSKLFAQKSNPFENLPEKERIQLADKYHDLSMQYYQTSKIHRVYKDSALMAVPNHVEYMQRGSYSYKKAGEHIKAMEMLNKAVAIDVANGKTTALEYKAWNMLYFYRDYESTIKDVDKIIEMTNIPIKSCHGEWCLFLKGQAYYQLKEYNKAIETFNLLLVSLLTNNFSPNDEFLVNFYLARSYYKLGNLEKSLEIFEHQLQMPYVVKAELYYYAGEIYAKQNLKNKALDYYKKSKELYIKNDKIDEPYFERFDEIFMNDIDEVLDKLKN